MLDEVHLLPAENQTRYLRGKVQRYFASQPDRNQPIADADVTLLDDVALVALGPDKAIRARTKTDSRGAFVFVAPPPRSYWIQIEHKGYYPETIPGYQVADGLEYVYHSIGLTRCPMGNCRIPRKPVCCCE